MRITTTSSILLLSLIQHSYSFSPCSTIKRKNVLSNTHSTKSFHQIPSPLSSTTTIIKRRISAQTKMKTTTTTKMAIQDDDNNNNNNNNETTPSQSTTTQSTPPPPPPKDTNTNKWKNKTIKTIKGPPIETKPDYNSIHGPLGKYVDDVCLVLFRTKFAEQVGVDSKLPKDDYNGLMELTTALNARYSDRTQVQYLAQEVLKSLFPSWLLSQFIVMFAKPFPKFSAKLNALATATFGTWLMGECIVNDCEIDNPTTNTDDNNSQNKNPVIIGKNQGVLVKRCRFLEESNCASICVNSCKIPTQKFFLENMGVPLTMTPDYETGECQFAFGLTPNAVEEGEAMSTPCLEKCPSLGGMRMWHDGKGGGGGGGEKKENGGDGVGSQCFLMENENDDESV